MYVFISKTHTSVGNILLSLNLKNRIYSSTYPVVRTWQAHIGGFLRAGSRVVRVLGKWRQRAWGYRCWCNVEFLKETSSSSTWDIVIMKCRTHTLNKLYIMQQFKCLPCMWPACVISLYMAPQEVSGVIHEQRNRDFFWYGEGGQKTKHTLIQNEWKPHPWAMGKLRIFYLMKQGGKKYHFKDPYPYAKHVTEYVPISLTKQVLLHI